MDCLLCVRKKRDMFEIFGEKGESMETAQIIAKYFWFQINPDDIPTKMICKQCWKKTNDFHLFYCAVESHQPNLQQHPIFDVVLGDLNDASKREIKDETTTIIVDCDIFKVKESLNDVVKLEQFSDVSNCENKSVIENAENPLSKEQLERKKPTNNSKKKLAETTDSDSTVIVKRKQFSNIENQKLLQYFKMQCDLCDRNLKDWNDAKTHYRQEHEIKGYLICYCCNEKYNMLFRILDHIEYCVNPEAFKCKVCDKNYEHRYSLQYHLLTHKPAEERQFKCAKCHRTYAKKGLLGAHLRTRHITDEDKQFPCSECELRCATQAILNSHVRGTHEGAYNQVCEICAKQFTSKKYYEEHKLYIHSVNPPPKVQCPNCGNWMRDSSMRSHVHSCHGRQEKGLHVCNICGKKCLNKNALQSHKRFVHIAQKLHNCSVCDKSFKRAISLKEHRTVHTGEVLYTCTYCTKTFNSNANMHAHQKKIHKAQWKANQLKSK